MRIVALALGLAMTSAACGGDDVEPVFPADYAASYQEVRGCRSSTDHDLHRIRVLADPAALGPYQARDAAFPVGATVLKAEYDFGDTTCSGPVVAWTVMQREADGGPAIQLGWRWQKVDGDRTVVSENEGRCLGCHAECGVPPEGYLGTCTVP